MRNRLRPRGCPCVRAVGRGGRFGSRTRRTLRSSTNDIPRSPSTDDRVRRFIGSSGSRPVPLRKRVSLAPSPPLFTLAGNRREMGGEIRAKSWVSASLPPSGRSLPCSHTTARLRGPSLGPCATAKSTREHDPPDLRCLPARHLPVRRSRRSPVGTASLGFVQRSPLRRSHSRSPLPGDPRGTPFGKYLPRYLHVPPSWFSTTSTACSSENLRVFATRSRPWGSPRFGTRSAGHPARRLPPRDAFPALRSFPSARSGGTTPPLPHANVSSEQLTPRDNVTQVLPPTSPLSLPPHPFHPVTRPVAAVTRACVSRFVL